MVQGNLKPTPNPLCHGPLYTTLSRFPPPLRSFRDRAASLRLFKGELRGVV